MLGDAAVNLSFRSFIPLTASTFPFSSYFLLISREKEVELEPLGRNCRRTLWSEVWIVTRLQTNGSRMLVPEVAW